MATLPEDIIADILSRLSIKPLLRFRSVSKSWSLLIYNPNFARLQLKRASSDTEMSIHKMFVPTNFTGLRSVDCEKSSNFDDLSASRLLKFPFPCSKEFRILGSCNGLLCVSTCNYDNFHLWNPSTSQYKKLPGLKYPQGSNVFRFGFGYDESTDDYKLFIATIYERSLEFYLFSLKQSSWRCFRDTSYINCDEVNDKLDAHGVFSNGSLHWIDIEYKDDIKYPMIVSFDLDKERFKKVEVPDVSSANRVDRYEDCLGVLDGCICLAVRVNGSDNICTTGHSIWMMKEYGVKSSWTEFRINSCGHPAYFSRSDCLFACAPLYFTRGGEIILKSRGFDLVCFDPRTGFSKKLFRCCGDHSVYVESLISPNAICRLS